ncbi:anaerobic sulfite reductase subunit AsrB [Helicovermis profundi]|uniref:Anaerobic sulfite reductase subunit AsrB n=1 Tax=Helicovermis profundi TaxID=3065157 RepID=A0AAU9E925_9FIRM|nr:anaerobic sulfite reductase subunit AsrB [Clostridia bacterium S502]
MNNPYLPQAYKILEIRKETAIDYTFKVAFQGNVIGGQFMEISIPGVGEAPISICNFDKTSLEMTIRRVGRLTDKIFNLQAGDSLFMRGPYGNGFDTNIFKNKDVAFIAGGTGLAPIRKTIDHFMTGIDETKILEVLVGFKSPSDRLFIDDLDRWSKFGNVTVTVDKGDDTWQGETGLITTHIGKLDLSNVKEKIAVVVGPPIMMKFTTLELIKNGFKEENIWVSFERKMSCGIGKCGHCKIDETYICLDGPVFNYIKAKTLID